MTAQHPSAPVPRPSGRPAGGVEHVHAPHTENFTVVGNHLAQHSDLSVVAIGLAVHIQSLPTGSPVGIKTLAKRLKAGEIRIAAGLRELEKHGYLARVKERLPSGRVVTRTLYRDNPAATTPQPEKTAQPDKTAQPEEAPPAEEPPAEEAPAEEAPAEKSSAEEPPAVEPACADPLPEQIHPKAARLLTRLGVDEPRLAISARDIRRLAPHVTAWLTRGIPATAIERLLTAGLPREPIRHPAAFLHHRLTEDLPPALPEHHSTPPPAPGLRTSLHNCDGCDRAFRAPAPGRCRDCRASRPRAA